MISMQAADDNQAAERMQADIEPASREVEAERRHQSFAEGALRRRGERADGDFGDRQRGLTRHRPFDQAGQLRAQPLEQRVGRRAA